MFNVTVISRKDIIKYLVSLTLTILMIFVLTRYFSNSQGGRQTKLKISDKISSIMNNSYLVCLDETIPNMEISNEEINKIAKEDEDEIEDESILKKILSIELSGLVVNKKQSDDMLYSESMSITKEDAKTDVDTKVITKEPLVNKYTNEYEGVRIRNETDYELTEDILKPDINIKNKNITIFHTHTCESYTSSEKYKYEPTGTYRTTDLRYTVAKVGDELSEYLKKYGYNVVHNKTYHDYPAYTGSYNRSLETIENLLKSKKSDIIIDIHRDAIGSNSNYAPTVKIGEENAAQLMFVIRNKWRWTLAS